MINRTNPVELFFNKTIEEMENDEYSRQYFERLNQSIGTQYFERLNQSIGTIFGVIDSEAKKHNNDRMRVSFMKSILHNMFLRGRLYELPEERFIQIMRGIYNTGHKSKDRVVDPQE